MLICPICNTKYQQGEFCKNEGAKLVPTGSVSKPVEVPKGADASPADDASQREKRVAELEAELSRLQRELKKLRESPATPDRPLAEGQEKPQSVAAGKTSPKSKGSPLDTVRIRWLDCVAGPLKGEAFPIGQEGLRIGRPKKSATADDPSIPDISIPDKHVSHAHAWIGLVNEAVVVRDQGSGNGTFVNGVEITKGDEVVLKPGDAITIFEEAVGKFVLRK
jgi:hypothetical protein